ncbi:MAG: DNA topoisomerase VI subunit B [Oligoflexia bacterium]|nr:DNA topoisomerase VI subunit B [Oligoflexia bacterium]
MAKNITSSSTAEYFAKNLQQVGFSSQTKAILTTLKESVDNALDACEEESILPELNVIIEKVGVGSLKNSDLVRVKVEDNGPGLEGDDLVRVFGEYLASSKFGRGRCSRGQQGIGISAATTWAQMTNATGVKVISKTKSMRLAISATIEVDIKHNKGVMKNKETLKWDRPHGVSVEFLIDGRAQVGGEGGLLTYLTGTTLVNPHLTLHYKLLDQDEVTIERVSNTVPDIPEATSPHPHTMKLGEFIAHSHLFGRVSVGDFLKKGFSRVHEGTLKELVAAGLKRPMLTQSVDNAKEGDFKEVYSTLQKIQLMSPSTKSVLTIGEEALSKSIQRLGDVDFFSVVTRKPTICDFKPVVVEVAIARLKERSVGSTDSSVQVLRFANRVPLQFDKSACAIVKAIESVNWRTYGLVQPKDSIPYGPYVIAISLVSPFIKFKNASKETVDASDELVNELRLALIQAGQKLSRHIRAEDRAFDLENKLRHIEQFGPILVEGLVRILDASPARKKKAEEGLMKLLGRDTKVAKQELADAVVGKQALADKQKLILGIDDEGASLDATGPADEEIPGAVDAKGKTKAEKGKNKKVKNNKVKIEKVKTKDKKGKKKLQPSVRK